LGRREFLTAAATTSVGLALDRLTAREDDHKHPAAASSSPHKIGEQYVEPASERTEILLEGPWKFIRSNTLLGAEVPSFDDAHWQEVKVPHSWQTLADATDYSNCWYRLKFTVPASDAGKRIYLYFEGVGITSHIYLNGVHLGRHLGAYTGFAYDATSHVKFGGENLLAVMCDSKKDIVGNLSRVVGEVECFSYWGVAGGLHRKVWLVKTGTVHMSPADLASWGVYVSESNVSTKSVDVTIKTMVRNADQASHPLQVRHSICDSGKIVVGVIEGTCTAGGHSDASISGCETIPNLKLWSPQSPTLYNVYTELVVDGAVRDVVKTRTGFRSIAMQDGHFILNGQQIRLIGSALLPRSEYNFYTPTDAEVRRDVDDLVEAGFNSAWVVCYPHDQFFYDVADEKGVLLWTDNGFVNGSYEPAAGALITKEMIRQLYNHPSIFCWSAANEPEARYLSGVNALLGVIKSERDPRRLTTYNLAGRKDESGRYNDPQADFWSMSLYRAWYGKGVWEPVPRYVNQDGAGCAITDQGNYLSRSYSIDEYEPEAYQQYVAEILATRAYDQNDYEMFWWFQLKDQETAKLRGVINSKGLITFAHYRKDVYYLFKAFGRSDAAVLHICGKHWYLRGQGNNAIKVYANARQVTLAVNGRNLGARSNGRDYQVDGRTVRNVFFWENALQPGRNTVTASDGTNIDTCAIYHAPADSSMPEDKDALITGLSATNGEAHYLGMAPQDQWPVYAQWDGGSRNTFDAIPEILRSSPSGRVGFIATHRQSNPAECTDLAFSISPQAGGPVDLYLLFTPQVMLPGWIQRAGFEDTGATGRWRNYDLLLVDYQIFKKTCQPGERVYLESSQMPTPLYKEPGHSIMSTKLSLKKSGETMDFVVFAKGSASV
jgi:beta-galactosidase